MTFPPPPGPVPHHPSAACAPPQQWVWTGPRAAPGPVVALRWVLCGQLLLAVTGGIVAVVQLQHFDHRHESYFTEAAQAVSGLLCLISTVLLVVALGIALSSHGGPTPLLWAPQPWIGGVGLLMVGITELGGGLVLIVQLVLVLTSIPALVLALLSDVRASARPEDPRFPQYLHPM